MLKDVLEIILITYNRKTCLEKTLNTLFAGKSPVKELDITVIDNNSTDATAALLAEFKQKHPNLKIIRNNKNIGPNANIAKIFEIAQKPYFWPLCDDDTYDFSAWQDVENAISQQADLIIVNTQFTNGDGTFPNMYRLLTFLPAAIHKTENITPQVLTNIYNNIPNWFPHLAAVAEVINKDGKVITVNGNIVKRVKGENDNIDFKKNTDLESKTLPLINRFMPHLPPSQRYKFLEVGYYKSCELIQNTQRRAQAVAACRPNVPFWRQMASLITWNNVGCNNYKENYTSLKPVFNRRQNFTFNLMYLRSYFSLPSYYIRKKKQEKEIKKAEQILINGGKNA